MTKGFIIRATTYFLDILLGRKKRLNHEYYYLSSTSICNAQLSVLEVLLEIKCIKIKSDP